MGTFYDREIEYLESTGAYITLPIVVNKSTYVCIEYSVTKTYAEGGGADSRMFGVWQSNSTCAYAFLNGANQIRHRWGQDAQANLSQTKGERLRFTASDNTAKNENLTRGTSVSTTIGNSFPNANFVLFQHTCGVRIYSAKIGNFDLIPVRVGNVGYLFDRVSCQLFGNAGTGSFVLGPDMYDSRIEYVGITGTSAGFDIGYVPNGTDIIIDTNIRFKSWGGSSSNIFYNSTSANTAPSYIIRRNGWANNMLVIGCGQAKSADKSQTYTLVANTLYNFRLKFGQVAINYVTYTLNTTASTTENTSQLYIGKSGNKQDVYYFKIYKADVLVVDLIPVRKGQVAYLYDRITNQLFGKSGTGDLLLGNDVPDVPSDYDAEVDYIVFDGTQSIDTGLYGDLNTDVKTVCKPSNQNVNIFGARNSDGTNGIVICGINDGRVLADFYDNASSRATAYSNPNNWVSIQTNKDLRQVEALNKTIYINNNTQFLTDFITPNSMRIGGFEGLLAVAYRNFIGQMGAVQIKQNGVLVRDYIPVRKNGVGYLYDKITQKMFGNEFLSSFAVGKDKVKPLPILRRLNNVFSRRDLLIECTGFKRLNYISNEGSSFTATTFPYIVIGRNVTPNTKIVIDYRHQANNSASNMLFGRWSNSDVNIQTRYSGTVGTWIAISNTIKGNVAVGNPVNHHHYLTVTKDGASDVVDNTTTYSVSYDMGSTFKISNPYLFWASNYYNWLGCRWRVYNFQLYENDVLVMDLIPVKNLLTNINGMYDKVSNRFLVSPRANFIGGPIIGNL